MKEFIPEDIVDLRSFEELRYYQNKPISDIISKHVEGSAMDLNFQGINRETIMSIIENSMIEFEKENDKSKAIK